MLLETLDRNVSSSGVMEVARATIRTSPKIFNFFADQTYANKPKAICRELVANAWDSHQMAGKPDLPVEVWLPTLFDPVFRVRDFGLGMEHSFMMNQFMCYADGSTKDQSNVAIGGFGIGSKSPFAYVDQYTVTSVFDGLESVYSVFKDEEGIPAIGLLGQRPTTNANGVEVSFPVKPDDFPTFEEAAFEALRYFEPLPEIKNATEGSFKAPNYVSRGTTWAMRENAGDLAIIMGGIRYPVSADNLTYKFPEDSAARKLLKYGLDLRVPIGTCSVALSREALSYDDRTIEGIRLSCEAVIDEVKASFATMFDHIDNQWEAAVALFEAIGPNGHSDRAKFLAEHAQWQGEPLGTTIDYPKLDKALYGYNVWHVDGRESRRRRGRVSQIGSAKWDYPTNYGFTPGRLAYLVIDDLPPSPKHKAIKKIKEFLDEESQDSLVLRGENLDVNAIIEGFGNPPADQVVLTSSLPEPIMERVSYGKNLNRPRVRMFTFDGRRFSYPREDNNLNPGTYGTAGIDEVPYEDQPESGILVVMESFKLPAGMRNLMDSKLIRWDELRFVNVGDAKKLKKANWTRFEDEHETRKKAAIAEYPELAQRLAVADTSEFHTVFDFFRNNPDVDFTSRKPLGQMFKIYKRYAEPLTDDQRLLARFVTAKLPRGIKPGELLEKLQTKQRKAWRLMQILPNHHALDEEDMQLFQENL